MSTYYGFKCPLHEEQTGCGIRNQDYVLKTLIPMREYIKELKDMDKYGYIEMELLGGFDGGFYDLLGTYHQVYLFDWLAKHHNCPIIIYDEYGKEYEQTDYS